ncbi:hypothetical protein [Christiangramia sediminis]|uniref:Uncharacterized protein n=1 Tax=Christiangramia sediminis TaxID=2881336 RepID=A0A9X1LHM1_9FLAO|nr:hypothetical protein [Christiangramia sediminis]MCB7480443.1 hypothetical protein [Christiangramia sediminis]
MTNLTKKLEVSFTTLEFFESVVISTVKEDILFDENHVEELRSICKNHFGDKKFIYIANRVYNYNVNPVIYINLIQSNALQGIAVISEDLEKLKTANFEKQFSPVPFELFQNKKEALVWAYGFV